MKSYFYKLYNLNVKSNIEILDMQKSESLIDTDINIYAKKIDNENILKTDQINEFNFEDGKFTLTVKDIAKYSVYDGKLINIEYSNNATPDEINLYLLGSCFGIVLYHRGYLPLHASAIETDKGCVFFSGDSGMGKSTTLKSFIKKGYKMVSDDVAALEFNKNEEINIYPSFPRTKMWKDAADKLNIDTKKLNRITKDLEKYSVPINSEMFSNSVLKPYIFYEINKTDKSNIYIEEITGMDKIGLLLKNTYRSFYLEYLNNKKEHFNQISQLAQKIKIKRIFRPENVDTLEEITKILENDFNQ